MPAFRHLEVWTEKQCIAGSTRVAFVKKLSKESDGCVALLAIEDDETLSVRLPAAEASRAQTAQGLWLLVRFADHSFDEWRIDTITKTRTTWTITAKSVLADLSDAEVLVDSAANGFPSFAGGLASATATDVVEFAIAHPRSVARGLDAWIAPGQIDCTTILESVQWDTAGFTAILRSAQAAVRSTGERCEIRLRPNGLAGYYVDLVREIGSDAAVVVLRDALNLVGDLGVTSQRRDQVTAAIVRGGDIAGFATGIGLSRWKVSAIAGAGPYVVTLADPAGGAGPIGADDQELNGALYHEATGDLLEISDSSAGAAQTVTLAAIGDLAVDDMVQFRTTDDPDTAMPVIEVADPARITTYGRKVGTFTRASTIGVPNLCPNAVCREWAVATALPDGWRWAGWNVPLSAGTNTPASIADGGTIDITQNTDPLYTKLGGKSLGFSTTGGWLISPPMKGPAWYAGMPMSVRLAMLLTQWSVPSALIEVRLGIELADGTILPWWENTLPNNRTLMLQPANGRPEPVKTVLANSWLDLELVGSDVTAPSTYPVNLRPNADDITALGVDAKGVVLLIRFNPSGAPPIQGYFDGVMIAPAFDAPPITEFGGSNTLRQIGNLVLSERSTPATEVTLTALDLERHDPTLTADRFVKGGTVRLENSMVPASDQLLRIIQYKPDYLRSKASQLVLSSRRRLISDLLLNVDATSLFTTPGSTRAARNPGTGTTSTPTTPTFISAPTLDSTLSTPDNDPTIIAIVAPNVTSVKIDITVNSSDYPTDATVRATTAVTSPFTKLFAALSLVPGDVVKAKAFGYTALGVESPPAFHELTVPDPVFVDPGVQQDIPIAFADSMGDAGNLQSGDDNTSRWDFIDLAPVPRATSGFGGGACMEEQASGGFNDSYWQWTEQGFPNPRPNDLHVIGRLNLNGQTIGYQVPLIQGYPTACVLALTPARKLKIIIWNGSGYQTLGTSASAVIPATGQVQVEFRAHSVTTGAATAYAWVRVNRALVEFVPYAGGANVHGFENLVFTRVLSQPGNMTSSIGFGTGSGFDYPWDPQNNDDGTYTATGYNSVGGIVGVQWDDIAVLNNAGVSMYDYIGDVTVCASFVTASGLSTDDGDTSYDSLGPTGDSKSYSITAIPSGAADILAVMPFHFARYFKPGASGPTTNETFQWTVTSGGSSVNRWTRISSAYWAFLDLATAHPWNTNRIGDTRWALYTDPATAAKWTRTAVNAISMTVTVDDNDNTNSFTQRVSQLGVEVAYRP